MKNNLALSWRALTIYGSLCLIFCVVLFRIFSIQINDRDFLTLKGKGMLLTSREVLSLRGGIYDRNNFPLAVSIIQYNLFALRSFSADDYQKINLITPLKKTLKR